MPGSITHNIMLTSCARGDTICLRPLQVDNIFVFIRQVAPFRHVGRLRQQQVDLLTLKVVFESRVTWATSVRILVFLGLSVLELDPMYATDRRQTDVRQKRRLMHPLYRGGGIIT